MKRHISDFRECMLIAQSQCVGQKDIDTVHPERYQYSDCTGRPVGSIWINIHLHSVGPYHQGIRTPILVPG